MSVPSSGPPAALAQTGPGIPGPIGSGLDPVAALLGSALGTFVLTLVVGAILIAVAEDYTVATTERLRREPLASFLRGFLLVVFLVLATVILAITVVGILLAIPLAVVAGIVWAIGAGIAYLAIGDGLVGHEDGWTKPLVVGAALAGGLALVPGLGALVAFAIGAAGFGAVLRDRV